MEENEVTQKKNNVGGDLAGRDIIKSSTYNFNNSQNKITTMSILLDKFQEDLKANTQLNKFIDELDYYDKPLDGDVVGLPQKLLDGKRENFLDYAKRVKEAYHKSLYRHQFSEAAQKMNVQLLAMVESYFMTEIYPRICDNEDPNTVNRLISELIVTPLQAQLKDNPLNLTTKEIHGMIYFLTGNCHIKWCK